MPPGLPAPPLLITDAQGAPGIEPGVSSPMKQVGPVGSSAGTAVQTHTKKRNKASSFVRGT